MVFELYLKSTQNGVSEGNSDVCLGPQLASHSLHAALTGKVKSLIVLHSFHIYNIRNFELCMMNQEERIGTRRTFSGMILQH